MPRPSKRRKMVAEVEVCKIMDEVALHQAAYAVYADPSSSTPEFWFERHGSEIAQEVILYGVEMCAWQPPEDVLYHLWQRFGATHGSVFLRPCVYKHVLLWIEIAKQMVRNNQWDELGSLLAGVPAAQAGHRACAPLYLEALMDDALPHPLAVLELCAAHVPHDKLREAHLRRILHWHRAGYEPQALAWLRLLDGELLRPVALDLLGLPGVDDLLENLAFRCRPEFVRAVKLAPKAQSCVADLGRPLASLSDQRLRRMVRKYAHLDVPRLEWHAAMLARNLDMTHCLFGPAAATPADASELLFRVRVDGSVGVGCAPHLIRRALARYPAACKTLKDVYRVDLQVALTNRTRYLQRVLSGLQVGKRPFRAIVTFL